MTERLSTVPRRRRAVLVVTAALCLAPLAFASSAGSAGRGPSNARRRALARLEVRHLLALAPLPAHARVLRAASAAAYASALGPLTPPRVANNVELNRFYGAPDGASAFAWLDRLEVARHGPTERGSSSGPGTDNATNLTFALRAPAIFFESQLVYTMVVTARGDLVMSVDATVGWTPQKPADAVVLAGAVRLVVVLDRGYNATNHRYATYSTSSPGTIAALRHAVNELPVPMPGLFSCTLDTGASLTLSFYDAHLTTPYAVAVADLGGCRGVTLRRYGATRTATVTAHLSGGAIIQALVARLLPAAAMALG